MISIKNLTKEFSGQKVLDGIDIDIETVSSTHLDVYTRQQ